MSPSPATPPSPSKSNPDCGTKFRAMLKCVETTGTTACTAQVNDFLACQRMVFRAALANNPTQPTSPSIAPKTEHQPYSSTHPTLPHSPLPEEPEHRDPLLQRVCEKQLAACNSLFHTVNKPRFWADLAGFGGRLIADIQVTLALIADRLGQCLTNKKDSPP